MPVEDCEVPPGSAIGRSVIDAAFFRDAHRVRLSRPQADVVDLFFAVFGHHPPWMKAALIVRNRAAARFGLAVPADADILRPARKAAYQVGDRIGPWPVFSLGPGELVAGRDNRHLDFRVSVLKRCEGGVTSAVVSTVCTTHNGFGRLYLRCIIPFHRWGVRLLLARAEAAGRL